MILKYTQTNVVVGTGTTVLSARNEKRKYLLIQNRSTEDVDIMIEGPAILGSGIVIAAKGNPGSAVLFSEAQQNLTIEKISGICTSGTKTVSVTEGVE